MNPPIEITQPTRQFFPHADSLRALYESSFPASERADFDALIASVARGERLHFIATTNDDLVGFALLFPLRDTDAILLEYFAVASSQRGRGIGSEILQRVVGRLREPRAETGIILEVESDTEGDSAEHARRARRIAFYERNGARVIEHARNYRVPNLAGAGTLAMKLLWLPLRDHAPLPTDEQLRAHIRAIYTQAYELAADDPLVLTINES
ncbi:MAG: GNAT family N-acetyltransferase [Chloroflexi bacterium]|nr:GNAT family N-acetyltransferase [Chloroflexota bacterium]